MISWPAVAECWVLCITNAKLKQESNIDHAILTTQRTAISDSKNQLNWPQEGVFDTGQR